MEGGNVLHHVRRGELSGREKCPGYMSGRISREMSGYLIEKRLTSLPSVKQYQAAGFRLSWYRDTCAEYVTPAGHVTWPDDGDWPGDDKWPVA